MSICPAIVSPATRRPSSSQQMQYRLIIEYDGSRLPRLADAAGRAHGAGRARRDALARLLGHPARAAAAGRTDAGVHAVRPGGRFHSQRELPLATRAACAERADAARPGDPPPPTPCPTTSTPRCRTAHAAALRVPHLEPPPTPSPFWRRYAWHIPWTSISMPRAAAPRRLIGEHDFTSFRAAGCDAAASRCGASAQRCSSGAGDPRHLRDRGDGVPAPHGAQHRRHAGGARPYRRSVDARRGCSQRAISMQAAATAPAHGLCLAEIWLRRARARSDECGTSGRLTSSARRPRKSADRAALLRDHIVNTKATPRPQSIASGRQVARAPAGG